MSQRFWDSLYTNLSGSPARCRWLARCTYIVRAPGTTDDYLDARFQPQSTAVPRTPCRVINRHIILQLQRLIRRFHAPSVVGAGDRPGRARRNDGGGKESGPVVRPIRVTLLSILTFASPLLRRGLDRGLCQLPWKRSRDIPRTTRARLTIE